MRYETRLGWVWVKPTGSKRKSARDFRLLCLLSLRRRSKTRDLRASETKDLDPQRRGPCCNQSSENNCGQVRLGAAVHRR